MSDMPSAAPEQIDRQRLKALRNRRPVSMPSTQLPADRPAHSHSADDGHSASGGCHNSADREPELLPAVSGDTSAAPL